MKQEEFEELIYKDGGSPSYQAFKKSMREWYEDYLHRQTMEYIEYVLFDRIPRICGLILLILFTVMMVGMFFEGIFK